MSSGDSQIIKAMQDGLKALGGHVIEEIGSQLDRIEANGKVMRRDLHEARTDIEIMKTDLSEIKAMLRNGAAIPAD